MPDTQTLLDRGYKPSEIRMFMGGSRKDAHVRSMLAKRAPVLDACNHAR